MPQAVPFFQAAAAWLAGKTALATLARIILQTLVLRALSKKRGAGQMPINVTIRTTISARQILLGKVRASGAVIFFRCSGSKLKYLWYVIAYAGHQTQSAHDGYLDKLKIPAADINNTNGDVATAALGGNLKWWTHRGTQAQTTDAQLAAEFASDWTANHRLRGISYDVLRMERDDKAWPHGAPQNVNRVISGALCYDPRLDSTNGGSGSHRMDDPSTWAYTNNLALCILWYLTGGSVVNDQGTRLVRYGVKESYDRIDWPYWVAAANKCDESVSGANAPPSGAQTRYTLNIEALCDLERRSILENLLAPGGPAQLIYVHGKWRLYVAAYDAASHAFTQDDLHGDMEIDDTSGEEERFNSISSLYIDAARDYTEQSSTPRTNSAYVTQDAGRELPQETELRGCDDEFRAQRICELMLRQARQMRTVRFVFGRQGLKVAPWETFTMDHSKYGWSGRLFRCIEREVIRTEDGAMQCAITARAEAAAIYDDLLTADYTTGTSVTNALQSEEVDAPTGLAATPLRRAIEFTWSLGTFWEQNGVTEIWEHTSQTPFSSATRVWVGRGTRAVIQKLDSVVRYYWVRVATIGDRVSDTEPATNGLPAAAQREMDIIADPNFELATDNTFWQAYSNYFIPTAATGVSIVNSGGVQGGVLQLTGDSSGKVVWNKRSTPYPVITGQNIRVRFRWRRTGTVNAANASDIIFLMQIATTDGAIPSTSRVVAGGPFAGVLSKTRADVAAVTVNQWQEDEFTGLFVNVPKTNAQLPYVELAIEMDAACTSGTIEIDQVQAHLI